MVETGNNRRHSEGKFSIAWDAVDCNIRKSSWAFEPQMSLREIIEDTFSILTKREVLVVKMRVGLLDAQVKQYTQSEVAKLIDRSPRTVRRAEASGLQKLRNRFHLG